MVFKCGLTCCRNHFLPGILFLTKRWGISRCDPQGIIVLSHSGVIKESPGIQPSPVVVSRQCHDLASLDLRA